MFRNDEGCVRLAHSLPLNQASFKVNVLSFLPYGPIAVRQWTNGECRLPSHGAACAVCLDRGGERPSAIASNCVPPQPPCLLRLYPAADYIVFATAASLSKKHPIFTALPFLIGFLCSSPSQPIVCLPRSSVLCCVGIRNYTR